MNKSSPVCKKKEAIQPNGLEEKILLAEQAHDWRLIRNGWEIPTLSYADQPYLVKADDGALVCVITTGEGHEGSSGQHVAVLRSLDHGRSWSDPISVESPENPESSYAVLLKVPSGRLYCFYNYNADNIREMETILPGAPMTYRVDTLGYHVFKYSDDHGKTWTTKYYKIPIRETEIDRMNVRNGKVRFLWNVGKPFVLKGAAYISIHKVGNFGKGFLACSEGWLVRSDNLLTERDPEKIRWETLPDGEIGLRTPAGGGPVAEEQSYTVLSDGSIYCVYRTIDGYLSESYSRDGGRTWTKPRYKCYADGRRMKNPRAAAFTWKCKNGRYLQWFHNHGGPFIGDHGLDEPVKSPYEDRNPVWVSAGIEQDGPEGKILMWSQPEILLYDDDLFIRMSYPDLIEMEDGLYITETQKNHARMHRIDPVFLERLWGQFDERPVDQSACLLEADQGPCTVDLPIVPEFSQRDFRAPDHRKVDLRQGFTLVFNVRTADNGRIDLLDNRTASGIGFLLRVTEHGRLELEMSDGQTTCIHRSDSGMICSGKTQSVAVVVDGGPKIVSFIIDGQFCDGGEERQFGWSRFSPALRTAAGSSRLTIAQSVSRLKLYGRALMTCEAVMLHRQESNGIDS